MNEIIYLDPDEEITSVIDKLKKSPSSMVSLAIPRGATLSQSIINLKLLRKSAADNDKEISLISNDRISRNLASQIGITVFTKVSEAEKAMPTTKEKPTSNPPAGGIPKGFSNFKVNSYKDEVEEEEIEAKDADAGVESEGEDEIRDEKVEKNPKEKEDEPEGDEDDEYVGEEESEIDRKTAVSAQDRNHESRKEKEDKSDYRPISNQNYKKKNANKPLIVAIVFAVILVLTLTYLFLPYASANVQVKTSDFSYEKAITIDPNLKSFDQNKLSVPGKVESVSKDITQTFKSTGQQKTPTAKAGGTITVYNSWSADPVTFAQGTKFTSSGKNFISTASVTVPGKANVLAPAGTANVSVEAENPGDDYNIGLSTFVIGGVSGVQQPYIYGKSAAAMAGGVTQVAKIVTDDDLKNAQITLEKSASDMAKPDLISKVNSDKLKYYNETIASQIISSSSTKNANDVADSFDYTVKTSLSVTAFSSDQLRTLVLQAVNNSLTTDKMLIGTDNAKVTDLLVKNNSDTGILDIKGGFAGRVGQKIAVSDIQNLIKNKSVSVAQNLIDQNAAVTKSTVTVWPKFIGRVPLFQSRIKVTFDYAQ